VPPLRERPEDISLLAYHFLGKYAAEFGKQVQGIQPAVIELLLGHRWEGNVRELENVLERAVAVAEGGQVTARDLPAELRKTGPVQVAGRELKPFQEAKQDFEVEYLKLVLEKARGNISLAARLTDIPRQNLYEKLSKYGIDKEAFRSPATET
jgi:DNA-binding NtrC family response regulator